MYNSDYKNKHCIGDKWNYICFLYTILTIMVKYSLCLFFIVFSFFQLIGQVLVLDTVRMQQLNLKYVDSLRLDIIN